MDSSTDAGKQAEAAVAYPIVEKKYTLTERIDETPEVIIARFAAEDGVAVPFDAGMFSMLSGLDSAGKRYVARALSIASDPSNPVLEYFIVKQHMLGAEMHTSYFTQAPIGTEFMIKGPNGQFRFDPDRDTKVCFIAGGTGLAPFMSMLRHLRLTKSAVDVKLFYSVKFPTEVILPKELKELEFFIKLNTTITVTRPAPGDGWIGATGHLNSDMFKKFCPDIINRMCYICGPLAFVKAIKEALAALGIPDNRISADVWG